MTMSREIDWAQVPIGEIALDAPVRVSSSATLREAAALMRDRAASCVLVGTGHRSILTEHDLAAALVAGMGPEALVEEMASPEPLWATTTTLLADAVRMMVRHGVRHLLVITADGRPHGVLSLPTAIGTLLV